MIRAPYWLRRPERTPPEPTDVDGLLSGVELPWDFAVGTTNPDTWPDGMRVIES